MPSKPDMVIAAPITIFEHVPEDSRVTCCNCQQLCAGDSNTIDFARQGIPIYCTPCAVSLGLFVKCGGAVNENDYTKTQAFQHLMFETARQGRLN